MKYWILYLLLCSAGIGACQESKEPINLMDSIGTHKKMKILLESIKTKNFKMEMKYRTDFVLVWDTVRLGVPDTLYGSLSKISDLNNANFDTLAIDLEHKEISRITHGFLYEEGFEKNRYLFYLNPNGLISEILFIPPMPETIKEYVDQKSELGIEVDRKELMRCYIYSDIIKEQLLKPKSNNLININD